ncbi:RloB domain-containing protein [Hallella absiana]|uniref:RloB domain-containing protein n=1 Tax=Hallella absiana TaxID=2925336 RepID=UPI003D218375
MKRAISIRDNHKKRGRTYDQSWVVFDKDDNQDKTFNDAIVLARKENFHVAYHTGRYHPVHRPQRLGHHREQPSLLPAMTSCFPSAEADTVWLIQSIKQVLPD